jgi:exopolysaccharide biosynthesis operon protein EpsL
MPTTRSHWFSAITVSLVGLSCGVTNAQTLAPIIDNMTLRAGLGLQHDDNFFRARDGTAVSEQITNESVGINLNIPVSLQRFELDVGLTNYLHRDFDSFDYLGKAYSAAWRWSFTPQLHGSLTSTRSETLNAPTDSLNPALRNKNATTAHGFDAVYELGGPWQLSAGYARTTSLNEQALIGDANERSSTYNAGLRYSLSSGNSLAYRLSHERGTNASGFTGQSHDVSGVWVVSGNTTLNGHLTYLTRDYSLTPQFDYHGVSSGINATWRATGKITVNAGWQRELSSYQTAGTTHTLSDSITLAPVWQISPITSLSGQYRYTIRRDQGNPTGSPSGRKDNTQETSLAYSWQPRPFVSLSASWAHAQRNSNSAGLNYSDNLVSLSAQLRF